MDTPATTSLTGLTIKDLLDAGLHFGHQTKRWNPKMKRYIFDKRSGIHIIDLTQTLVLIEEAAAFLRGIVLRGGRVLFVATKKQAQDVIKQAAVDSNQFHMTSRWLGGTLTNNQTIRRSIKRMRQIETIGRNNNGVLSVHKKEAANLRRELDKLQTNLAGIADMERLPAAIFIVDVCRERIAVEEARRLGIPLVAVVDTNADPDPIDYIIPSNDDAIRAVKLIADAFAKVIKEASEHYNRVAAEKTRQVEAERASADASDRAARRARADKEKDDDAESAAAKAKLARQRRTAAKSAKDTVVARAAAVEPAGEAAAEVAVDAAADDAVPMTEV
jgi:small subunit ribosomal protein S2